MSEPRTDTNDIRNAILAFQRFNQFHEGQRFNSSVGYIKVVDVNDEERPGSTGYNEYEGPQGWTGKASITFFVEDQSRYYRQYGTLDSYYAASWDGMFKEVSKKTREVTFYE